MSASLVGSEMCIRDRTASSRDFREISSRSAGQPQAASGCFLLFPRGGGGCLLYTSDAADDM
eukprot:15036050-Alexandrium_andersonii.AAC.1